MLGRLKKVFNTIRFSTEDVENRLNQRLPKLNISVSLLLLIGAILAYTITFSYFTILRNYDFQSSGWDLGIYMQSLYTAAFHGEPLRYTIELFAQNPSGTFFGVHFSPLVLLLVPIYRLAPLAETLLILQSFVVALGAAGLYLLSEVIHLNKFASLTFALSYLLCTPLQAANWFDFHIQAFIPIFFFMMFYFFLKENYTASYIFLVLTLSTIEIMPVLLLPFGLYCLISNRRSKKALFFALGVMCTSILWFLLGSIIKSSINPMSSSTFGAWSIWGTSYTQLLAAFTTRPLDMLAYFFTVSPLEKALYFLWLVAPLLFLPLLARKEFILLVLPWIAMVFLSSYQGYFTNQYATFVVPQLFIAAVYGLSALTKSIEHIKFRKSLIMRYSKWVLWTATISFILVGPFALIPQAREVYIHGLPTDNANKQALREALLLIPDNSSVYTSFRIEPHLANRFEIYSHSVPDKPPEYIVIDLKLPDSSISLGSLGEAAIVGADELLQKYNYSMLLSNDGVLVYKLSNYTSTSEMLIALSFDYTDLVLDFGTLVQGSHSQSDLIFAHTQTDWTYGFWHGPYVALPRGTYEVTYRVKCAETPEGHLMTLDATSGLGQNTLARKYVYSHDLEPNTWKEITLQFSTAQPETSVEFRGTYASNLTTEYLDIITLKQCQSQTNATVGAFAYKYNDLNFVNGNLSSNDITFHWKNDTTPLSFGLWTEMPQGNYTLGLWLRIDALPPPDVFFLTLDSFNGTILAQMDISSNDFAGVDVWTHFSCKFTVEGSASVCVARGISNSSVSISFSYLELEMCDI